LTPDFGKLSISPESSDGFASVGTILPKEEATLLPGGLFAFPERLLMGDIFAMLAKLAAANETVAEEAVHIVRQSSQSVCASLTKLLAEAKRWIGSFCDGHAVSL